MMKRGMVMLSLKAVGGMHNALALHVAASIQLVTAAVSHGDAQPGEHRTDAAVPAIISDPDCRDR